MIKFFKIFWATLGSLAGIAALYVGAESIHVLWAFWLIVAAAVVVAGGWVLVPKLRDLLLRMRKYPTPP